MFDEAVLAALIRVRIALAHHALTKQAALDAVAIAPSGQIASEDVQALLEAASNLNVTLDAMEKAISRLTGVKHDSI